MMTSAAGEGPKGNWIYPVTLPNGGTSVLFKTLVSNVCSNDCKYCPLRANQDVRRCTLNEEETVNTFLDYHKRGEVFGLFLSSGVLGTPDATMERLNRIAKILRYRRNYRGYIHLKVIPGASANAIEEAVKLSSAVSLNIETPGAKYLAKLSDKKRFLEDIVEPIKLISRLTGRGNKYHRVKQTTQFIVGAADETDSEIVKYMWGLYDRLNLRRIYFSAYQKALGNDDSNTLFTIVTVSHDARTANRQSIIHNCQSTIDNRQSIIFLSANIASTRSISSCANMASPNPTSFSTSRATSLSIPTRKNPGPNATRSISPLI